MTDRLLLFAVAAPGLEALCAAELRALGIAAAAEPGGAAWEGTMDDLHRANLWLRTASRVVVRAASFRARTFIELERHARKVPSTNAPQRPAATSSIITPQPPRRDSSERAGHGFH